MQEKSVLELDEIPEILAARYGFSDVSAVTPLSGGSANLWTVRCDGKAYVLAVLDCRNGWPCTPSWNVYIQGYTWRFLLRSAPGL